MVSANDDINKYTNERTTTKKTAKASIVKIT